MAKKLPSFMFYPGDWRKDAGVQSLDYEERGVWFELIIFMWECEERGKLILNGKPMTETDISRLLGLTLPQTSKILATLLAKRVAKIEQNTGVIYCKHIVDDEHLRKVRAEAGSSGGSKTQANRRAKPTPSSSSSSSSSSTSTKRKDLSPTPSQIIEIPPDLLPNQTEIREWLAYKREKGEGYKPRGLNALWGRLREIPEERRGPAIRASMAANYKGVFEVKGEKNDDRTKDSDDDGWGDKPIPGKYAHLSHRNVASGKSKKESNRLEEIVHREKDL